MNVAFLFNSDHPDLDRYYGGPVMDLVLGAHVLQGESRSMRVSVGDVLTYSAVSQDLRRSRQAMSRCVCAGLIRQAQKASTRGDIHYCDCLLLVVSEYDTGCCGKTKPYVAEY